jgi:hypothetical protein
MTTTELIALRVFNVCFGRFALFDRALRFLLVEVLVHRREPAHRYSPSSRFFVLAQLEQTDV